MKGENVYFFTLHNPTYITAIKIIPRKKFRKKIIVKNEAFVL